MDWKVFLMLCGASVCVGYFGAYIYVEYIKEHKYG